MQKDSYTDGVMNGLTDLQDSLATKELHHFDVALRNIKKCSREQNLDKKIQLLKFINSVLPQEIQLRIPSLVTDDYVESALYNLEMACKG